MRRPRSAVARLALLGVLGVWLARRARRRTGAHARARRGRARGARRHASSASLGLYLGRRCGARARLLLPAGAPAPSDGARPAHGSRQHRVYNRPMFEIGNSLREARTPAGLDFAEVERRRRSARKYLRALEDEQFDVAAGADVRQGLPAHVRRVPRARRPALRRRVQLALRRRRGRTRRADRRRRSGPRARSGAFESNVVLGRARRRSRS